MAETLIQYVDYLKNIKGFNLTQDQQNRVLNTTRMLDLVQDQFNGEITGEKFLKGLDAQDKQTRSVWWYGTHQNIYDESSKNIEMTELVEYLRRKMK